MTKPSAPASYGREPVADSAPILLNLMNDVGPMLASTPPVITMSKAPSRSPSTAAVMAAMDDAHAASVTKFGPCRSNSDATRPAMMLDSSPGMVSSVMAGKRPSTPARSWSDRARCCSSGSAL